MAMRRIPLSVASALLAVALGAPLDAAERKAPGEPHQSTHGQPSPKVPEPGAKDDSGPPKDSRPIGSGSTAPSHESDSRIGGGDKKATEPVSGLPTGTKPGAPGKDGDGKTAHPGDFSRDKQLKDLADPKSGLRDVPGAGGDGAPPGQTSPGKLVDDAGKGPARDAGRNKGSKQGNASEDGGAPAPIPSPSADKTGQDGGKTTGGGGGTIPMSQGDNAGTAQGTASGTVMGPSNRGADFNFTIPNKPIPSDAAKSPADTTKSPADTTKPSVAPPVVRRLLITPNSTPNPETDQGDGHLPRGLSGDDPKKTQDEVKDERKRQVTQPGPGATKPGRVTPDPKEAAQYGVGKRGDGRTDPGRSDDGTSGATGPRDVRPGSGPEQVDKTGGVRGPGGTIGSGKNAPPAPGGSTPDNPTATGKSSTGADDPANPRRNP